MFGRTIVVTSHEVIDRCAPAAIRGEAEAGGSSPRLPVSRELALPLPQPDPRWHDDDAPARCSEKRPKLITPAGKTHLI